MRSLLAVFWSFVLVAGSAWADGPKDNLVDNVRQVPPPGIKVPDNIREELTAGVDALGKEIDGLKKSLKGPLLELLPDVQIFHKAVHDTLTYNEFYNKGEFGAAKKLLKLGGERAAALKEGKAPWLTTTGPSVRGYLSKIDGSVQPYGLYVPANYKGGAHPFRLEVWFHGRFESNSEVGFVSGMIGSTPPMLLSSSIGMQPYGRYSNANHFAGEIDTLEAIDNVSKHYVIDPNRIVVKGFSMGGAATWNFAVHYADRWSAAQPGAGFSESPDFLRVYQNEKLQPTWYEKKLFHLYDCIDWCLNLTACPTVAYSGEKDSQKQAADIMAKAMTAQGLDLVHIIGPGMMHSFNHPVAKAEIMRRVESIQKFGRPEFPKALHFVTYTLRYDTMRWIAVDRIAKHWERSQIDGEFARDSLTVKTKGIERFTVALPPGAWPWDITRKPTVVIDDIVVPATQPMSDRSWKASFVKAKNTWTLDESKEDGLTKHHGLTGPIDDAFMDRFVVVRPTGTAMNEKVGAWTAKELEHCRVHWRKQFRGEAPVKDDTQITEKDIASSNLILFGDPSSNAVLKKIADKLPIAWTDAGIRLGKDGKSFDGGHHALAMIYPNPLNPKKYVVLNSGFTFREYDYLNNARQIPKLPDWVVFDINQPTTSKIAAGVADAAFFGERWELTPDRQ
ncbi:MAG TPA: prolyl oligopeptidase family serine peptidase [Gemmataceae bacterium]|nr:prolyl oligopeptidase family serine peptidase [Gemmataceae bacterium]